MNKAIDELNKVPGLSISDSNTENIRETIKKGIEQHPNVLAQRNTAVVRNMVSNIIKKVVENNYKDDIITLTKERNEALLNIKRQDALYAHIAKLQSALETAQQELADAQTSKGQTQAAKKTANAEAKTKIEQLEADLKAAQEALEKQKEPKTRDQANQPTEVRGVGTETDQQFPIVVAPAQKPTIDKSGGPAGASAGVATGAGGMLFGARPIADPEKIQRYRAEFEAFVQKLRPFQSQLGDALSKQMTELKNEGSSGTGINRKYAFMKIINAAKSASKAFVAKNTQFFIDQGFRRKLGYLMMFDDKYYASLVGRLAKESVEPFYDRIELLLRSNVTPRSGTDDPDEILAAKEVFVDSISKIKEKLYALYNNKITPMDVFNSTFFVIYFLKALRVFFIWFALYLASKIFQQYYTSKVFANNLDPPDLRLFIAIFWGLEALFTMGVMIFLLLLMFIYGASGDFIINRDMMTKYMVDYVVSTIFILIIGTVLASTMQKKKYFRYKTDGLRAIRSLQDMMLGVSGIVSIIPFFLL